MSLSTATGIWERSREFSIQADFIKNSYQCNLEKAARLFRHLEFRAYVVEPWK